MQKKLAETEATLSFSKRLKGDGLIVLCYHRVIPKWILNWGGFLDPRDSEFTSYSISTEEFASQLNYLKQHGVRFVTPQEAEDFLTGRQYFSGKLVLITFDDGDISTYKHAFPLLREKNIPFLLFFITGCAGKNWEGFKMCSWEQVKEMVDSGLCDVGLHTYDLHYIDPETNKPIFLLPFTKQFFTTDTEKGIACFEKHLGIKVKYFAYPYGFGTPITDRVLKSHGIPNIFTLRAKVNQPGDKQSFIGRILITSENWSEVVSWVKSK